MRGAYYNELDPYAAQWLRNLIAAGHIAPGDVDERSIAEVDPSGLAGYSQCHFFAGIGGWSYALRLAGWPDDKPIWTGSAPCQPFSSAGKQKGFGDSRHLWPEFYRLIAARNPELVVGEQVPAAVRFGWLDAVFGDLERAGYASGAVVLGAHSVGAPHIRQRLFWMARAEHGGFQAGQSAWQRPGATLPPGADGGMADTSGERVRAQGLTADAAAARGPGREAGQQRLRVDVGASGAAERLANTVLQQQPDGEPGICAVDDAGGRLEGATAPAGLRRDLRSGPTDGFWRDADWLFCRDGRWRPIEPGLSPLAHGTAVRMGRMCADWRAPAGEAFGNRKGRLKGYGNAIVAPLAAEFARTVMEVV